MLFFKRCIMAFFVILSSVGTLRAFFFFTTSIQQTIQNDCIDDLMGPEITKTSDSCRADVGTVPVERGPPLLKTSASLVPDQS
ncbi:hypothetical protein L1987_52294 [Smallanthus sonchifolius]|uniref:Uncharacterized protein n=1 Tax=Smallanthus sonchifolius TaxID=185202 RepID=A0ACB9ESR2_9ASTR|nr:hypothetical protein L1987_52294 [Smallanthus sonchifolius]